MNDVQRLSVLQECLALVRRNRRDSSGALPAVASSSALRLSEAPSRITVEYPLDTDASSVPAPSGTEFSTASELSSGAVAAVADAPLPVDDGAVVFDAPLPVDDVTDGFADEVKPGAVSEARAVSPRHATAFDSHEELFRHEETLASDAAGSTLEHEDEDDQRTPSPFRNDSDRPTNPPLSLAQPALFVVPPLPMLPSDWRVDAEVVRELPSEFEEHGFAPVAADALEVPPAAASRTVSRGLDHSMLNPLVESPAFDEAFDVLDFDGELPAARLDSFGDVLDTALSLG